MIEQKQSLGIFLRLCVLFALSSSLTATTLFFMSSSQPTVEISANTDAQLTLNVLTSDVDLIHIKYETNAIHLTSSEKLYFAGYTGHTVQIPASKQMTEIEILFAPNGQTLSMQVDEHLDLLLTYNDDFLSIKSENNLQLHNVNLTVPLEMTMVNHKQLHLGELVAQALTIHGGDILLFGPIATKSDVNIHDAETVHLVESELQVGGHLWLDVNDSLIVRDSEERPFLAQVSGNIQLNGEQQIDISALNHPESALVSGGDISLRSHSPVRGDALYLAGGQFHIEQPDGQVGDLISPYDPIVLADGDVTLGNYTGASLHIVAGGSVVMNSIVITGSDTAANTINSNNLTLFNGSDSIADLATVLLSNGTSVPINGNRQATLDIRAGVDWSTFVAAPGDQVIPSAVVTPTFAASTSAAITVSGEISVAQSNGLVLLTNQYRPNTALSGNIATDHIDAQTNQLGENGGSIVIDSRGDINTGGLDAFAQAIGMGVSTGDGGSITALASNGAINTTGDVNTFALSPANNSGPVGNGGETLLSAANGINIDNSVGSVNSFAHANSNGDAGAGGAITLETLNGDITAESLNSYRLAFTNTATLNNGGNITVSTNNGRIILPGSVFADSIRSFSVTQGESGDAGDITITATQGINLGQDVRANATGDNGNGAQIRMTTTNGDIAAGDILVEALDLELPGFGGDITLQAVNGAINVGNLHAQSDAFVIHNDSQDGGNIVLQALGGDATTGEIFTFSEARGEFGDTGNGGSISVTANGSITASGSIQTYALAQSNNTNSGVAGFAGNITLQATEAISIAGRVDAYSSSNGLGGTADDAGNIVIVTTNGNIRIADGVGAFASTIGNGGGGFDVGNGGDILLAANTGIDVSNGRLQSYARSPEGTIGSGGHITAATNSGDILIEGAESHADNLFAGSSFGTGRGGNITLSTGNGRVIVDPQSPIFTFLTLNSQARGPEEAGDSGDIIITATQGISVLGQIWASASGILNNGGDVTLTTNNGNIATDDIHAFSVKNNNAAGNSGDVFVHALSGGVSTGNVQAHSEALLIHNDSQDGGDIVIMAGDGDVTTGELTTFTEARGLLGDTGNGGEISITSTGSITTAGPIASYAWAAQNNSNSGLAGDAGNVSLQASQGISIAGGINSFSAAPGPNGQAANAGYINVLAGGDVLFTAIDARSRAATGIIGNGGVVEIRTDQFVRGTDVLFNTNETIANDGLTNGNHITISHGGGGVTPFIVGDGLTNGVIGALNSGDALITPTASFLYSHFEVPNIWILSVPLPLSITKSATANVNAPYQGEITYTVELNNPAAFAAVAIALTDTLPVEVDFNRWVQQPVGANVAADVINWNGNVAANSTITFAFVVDHVGELGDVFTNTADYVHPLTLGFGSADAAVQIEQGADLRVVKTAVPDTAVPGQTIQYTLDFSNIGADRAQNVIISDLIPVELTNVTVENSGAAITPTGGISFTWMVDDLNMGAGGAITVTGDLVTPLARGLVFSNTAVISTTNVDANANNNQDTVEITVLNVAPQAVDDTTATNEDTLVNIDVLANDEDLNNDGLLLFNVGPPNNGTTNINGNSIDYDPTLNFNGFDTFTYTVSDGLLSQVGTVTVTVNAINDDPVALDNAYNTAEDTPLTINAAAGVLSNDSDVDDVSLTAVLVDDVTSGLLSLNEDGSFVFTPTLNFGGIVSFTYVAVDLQMAASNVATVTINVGEENDAPVAVDDLAMTDEDTAVLIDVLLNDSDPDGDSLSLTAVSNPANGTAQIQANQLIYSPTLNFNGINVFTYTVSDGQINVEATITVTVNAVNDPPLFTSLPVTDSIANNLYSYTLTAEDVDIGTQLTFTATFLPNWLTLTNATDTSALLTGVPTDDVIGDQPITAIVSDGELEDTQSFTITVKQIPEYKLFLPIIVEQPPVIIEPADVIISDLLVTTDAITVVVANIGAGPTTAEFWVDVYVNPTETPTINRTWQLIANHGLAWGVTDPIPAGETITLTLNGTYFVPEESDFVGLIPEDIIWAQVDSVNLATTHGNLLEADETNNVYGPVFFRALKNRNSNSFSE